MADEKLHIRVLPGYLVKLRELASASGLQVEDYVSGMLSAHVLGIGGPSSTSAGKKPIGRPITVHADDLPDDIERASTAAGFAGVSRRGRLWAARLSGDLIGQFSSPEVAAIARHYTMVGFRVGRGDHLAQYMPRESALELASRVPYSTIRPTEIIEPTARTPKNVSPFIEDDPDSIEAALAGINTKTMIGPISHPASADSGPATPETHDPPGGVGGSRETPREGARESATSTLTLPWPDDSSQAPAVVTTKKRKAPKPPTFPSTTDQCPVCHDDVSERAPGMIVDQPELCDQCNEDHKVWSALPPAGTYNQDPPKDGVYTTNKVGGAVAISFAEFVRRARSAAP